jgi:beta-galactosidase
MQKAGITLVRLAEFSWSRLEPEEEVYNFSWLDKAIDVLQKRGIRIILCTPTAAPPAWLVKKHPDILPTLRNGQKMSFGGRRHYCITNKNYRFYTEKIVKEMGSHYAHNPAVIGWQIDNEFGGFGKTKCYCENCKKEFQKWLRKKYGTLDLLNKTWGNIFWSQEYSSWEEIPLPILTYHNPGLDIDFRRFFSEMIADYSLTQSKILKEINPHWFVTHNFMGLFFEEIDYHELAKIYDFVSWDNYPETTANRWLTALTHDVMRSLKKKNFWVMEQQCSYITRATITHTFAPGEMRLWTYQAFAHGAEAIIYFRWRACPFGIEQLHSGILRYDGEEDSISYIELKQIGKEIDKIRSTLSSSKVISETAIIYDYEDIWANAAFGEKPLFDYQAETLKYYLALKKMGLNVDIVRAKENLDSYRLVAAPFLFMVDEEIAENLKRYVNKGGILIANFRCGVKDKNNNLTTEVLPGKLRELFGIEIRLWDQLGTRQVEVMTEEGTSYQANAFADIISPTSAKVIARYTSGWYSQKAAVTENAFGKGKAYYVGCSLPQEFFDILLRKIFPGKKLIPEKIEVPEEVELNIREKEGQKYLFLTNFADHDVKVSLHSGSFYDLLEETRVSGEVFLKPFDVKILKTEGV